MKAVMYGAGNIGRGFIGALLSQSGYEVTFIDVADSVVSHLQQQRRYPIRYVSQDGFRDVMIEDVTAVHGGNLEAASDAIAQCDIMATAVGARILKQIVPVLAAGLRKRWAAGERPLNIIICENLMDANLVLEGLLKEQLTTEEKTVFDRTVGLVEASIGRMVPIQTEAMKDGEPMRVCVEQYGFLPVDKAAFKGNVPEIRNMVPFAPFDFYIKRKLFLHNMGHAVCAYLGSLLDLKYIYQAIDAPEIRIVVQNAMLESAQALSGKYGVTLEEIVLHITDLQHRFANAALQDTCERVGRDPSRKLGPDDRLIGAALLAMEQGISPSYIAVGAAAGLWRYIREAGLEQGRDNAKRALAQLCGLCEEHTLATLILDVYIKILSGATVAQLRRAADEAKGKSLRAVI